MSPVLPILRGDNKVVLRPFRRLAISSSVSSVLSQKYSGPAYSASTKGFRSFKFFFAIMIVLSCKLRDGLSVTEVPRCKGKQNSRKSKTFGCFFEVRGARYEVRGTRYENTWINISCVYSHSSHLAPRTSYLEKNLAPRTSYLEKNLAPRTSYLEKRISHYTLLSARKS